MAYLSKKVKRNNKLSCKMQQAFSNVNKMNVCIKTLLVLQLIMIILSIF